MKTEPDNKRFEANVKNGGVHHENKRIKLKHSDFETSFDDLEIIWEFGQFDQQDEEEIIKTPVIALALRG